ncbi:PREDICTED: SCAN domain-containing protein 3-like [Dinoponera quadriceps]|uniref:SCAN domain-containing protein 3-like n=1 Tax=Dinoponera quadriceps TaxID=609295 RepID=A0A6P3XUB5_DINQU|nr:PREDICTED: SCAN domain-containing protein 3-like [Dinoponera quadriceps]
MSEAKKKRRQYSVDYIKYIFIENPTNPLSPMCLICQATFSNEAMKPSRLQNHLNKVHSNKKDKNVIYFQDLKKKYTVQPTISKLFSEASKQDDDGLRASYNISLLIAKTGKLHTIGEDLILPALDESTLPTNEALLLSYVRFIKDEKICQELLFSRNLETDAKGETIFNKLEKFCDVKESPLNNITSATTDGAPAMTGRYKGFITYLKNKVPGVLAVHCVIHRQHLVARNPKFLENKDTELRGNLIILKNDIAYLTDLYILFNDVNLQLQGDDLNLIKTKNIVPAFVAKLLLYRRNIGRHKFNNFPNLSAVSFSNDDLLIYCQHLKNLHDDFKERFQDILNMDIPDWVLDPFSNVNTAGSFQLEEQLIKLTTNEELKIKFKNGYQEFWLQKRISQLYPGLWSVVQRFLIAFPSSYLCERGFSVVATLLTKKRNRLQVTERGDLRLISSEFEPDINKLVKTHQIHPSH